MLEKIKKFLVFLNIKDENCKYEIIKYFSLNQKNSSIFFSTISDVKNTIYHNIYFRRRKVVVKKLKKHMNGNFNLEKKMLFFENEILCYKKELFCNQNYIKDNIILVIKMYNKIIKIIKKYSNFIKYINILEFNEAETPKNIYCNVGLSDYQNMRYISQKN